MTSGVTGDGPGTVFDAAVGWLRERQVVLPAASTLARLVGRVGEEATERFWDALATIPTPAHESGTNRGRHEFADPC